MLTSNKSLNILIVVVAVFLVVIAVSLVLLGVGSG
jgi:nitrogen fixation-related uncharacterized protein